MTLILAILNGLVAIPKIAGYIELLCAGVTSWWVQRQNSQTQAAIADAAALGARAQTDEDRYAVAKAWQTALAKPRVSVD